jgi:hypothetical protein
LNFNDPSGHKTCSDDGYCGGLTDLAYWQYNFNSFVAESGISLSGSWTTKQKNAVYMAVIFVGIKFSETLGGTAANAFSAVYGNVNFTYGLDGASGECQNITSGGCTSTSNQINFATISDNLMRARNNVVHELGHAFENLWKASAKNRFDPASSHPANVLGWTQSFQGFEEYFMKDFPNRSDFPADADKNWRGPNSGFASRQNELIWQMSTNQAGATTEEFADQFLGWTFGVWADSDEGTMRSQWMDEYMPLWVNKAAGK